MSNYTTQMDAARKGIVTPEIEKVAKKRKDGCRQADGACCKRKGSYSC